MFIVEGSTFKENWNYLVLQTYTTLTGQSMKNEKQEKDADSGERHEDAAMSDWNKNIDDS